MDQKRDMARPDNRRPRRKKKRRPGPEEPLQQGTPGNAGGPQKQGSPSRHGGPHQGSSPTKQSREKKPQDRRKEASREKAPRAETVSAAPRDLRLGSPHKDQITKNEPLFRHVPRRYGIAVYETFAAAKADKDQIAAKAQDFDQYNVVIKAEGNMDDPELLSLGPVKIFAGAAWALIHERRVQDGWYEAPR